MNIKEFFKPDWKKLILPIFSLMVGLVLYFLIGGAGFIRISGITLLFRDLFIIFIILSYLFSCLLEYLSNKFNNKWISRIGISFVFILIILLIIYVIYVTTYMLKAI